MRLTSLVMLVVLGFGPGCALSLALAPPAIGAVGGAAGLLEQHHPGSHASPTQHAVIGALLGVAVGLAVDLAVMFVVIKRIDDVLHAPNPCPSCN